MLRRAGRRRALDPGQPDPHQTFAQVQPALREAVPLRLVREEELVLEEDPAFEEELVPEAKYRPW